MEDYNQTSQGRFILLGLSDVLYLKVIYFLLFLEIYIIALSGNFLLIIVVRINLKLQTPMYFFLTNLSIIDICFCTAIVPKILTNTLAKDKSISLQGCAAQMFFHLGLGATECVILAVMAYDRFAAICKPLQYNTVMSKKMCCCLAAGSWSIGFMNSAIHTVLTFRLTFCGSHVNHYSCEMPPLFRLSCIDTWLNEIVIYFLGGIISICAFTMTLNSYVHIISAILKIRSSQGRHKAFNTCTSHITVVSMFYGTIMFMYLRPRSAYSPEIDKIVSILYTAVTPMLNPIIYSIRNKEVIGTIKKNLPEITA